MTPNFFNSFANAFKSPATYILMVFVSMFWFFINVNNVQNIKNDENCQKEKEQLRQDLILERKKNDNLINSILINKGVISRLSELVDTNKIHTNENK